MSKPSLEIPLLHRIVENWGSPRYPVQSMVVMLKDYAHKVDKDEHHVFDYLRCEADVQIPKLSALGINTDDCFFEQAINAVIFMAEHQRAELASLKAENEALKSRCRSFRNGMIVTCKLFFMSNIVQNKEGIVYNEAFISLTTVVCYKCGVPFAMPERLRKHFLDSGESFHCPSGHSQAYTISTEDRLKKQMEQQRQEAERKIQQLQNAVERRDRDIADLGNKVKSERGRANYHKGKRKVIEARIAHGVCPHCNRTFEDIAKHMASKHPEELGKR